MTTITREEAVTMWAAYKQDYEDQLKSASTTVIDQKKESVSKVNSTLYTNRSGSYAGIIIAIIMAVMAFIYYHTFREPRKGDYQLSRADSDPEFDIIIDNPEIIAQTNSDFAEDLANFPAAKKFKRNVFFGFLCVAIIICACLGALVIDKDLKFITNMTDSFKRNQIEEVYNTFPDVILENKLHPDHEYTSIDDLKIVNQYP